MFYSVQLLGKTSPLGKLWLAAHADKRLKRQDINSTDVPQSVEQIIQPSEGEDKMPLALRLSGLLLLGLVKIYSRQLQYLQEDCLTAVQELDKADKVAGLGKGQNKQQRKNAKLALANQQDVTIDEPRQFFRLSSLSDEEGFGLFEESHAGMAMAAQAHASFMNMEYSLSQSDPRDDSAMVHLDEPEQLRAVPVDFEDEMEPALPFGDELPRMTPTKRLGRSASRDRTPEAMKTDQAEMSNLGPEPAPEDRDDSTLAAPLPIDDLPDLPPIVRPSAVAANGGAPEDGGPPAPEFYGTQNDGANVVVNIGERCQQESEAVPDDVQDHAPDPMPDVGSDIMPEITPDLDAHTLDEPMFDAPELPDDVEDINAKPLEKEAEAAASTDPRLDDACTGDQQGKTASRSPKGKQSRQTVSEAAGAISKRTRKRNAPKLRRDSDKESTTVSSEETRELLKNRTSLICKLPPIVSKTRLRSKPLNTDVLDVLLVPSAVQEPSLDNRIVRLFEAIGSCRPLSLNALRGDDESAGPDEIEDVVPAPDARGDQTNVTSTGAAEVEVLRDARPSVSGSHVVLPPLDQARLLEADEREGSQGNAGDAMLEDDALDMDMPAMVLPDVDVPQFAMTRADVQPLDMPSPEMPSPGMSPPEMPPGIPEAYGLSEAQPGHQGHIAELGGVHPAPPGGTSGMQTQSADAPHEYTPVETLYTAPGTQGTGSAEDSSLNAHTLHTLERLERLTQILPDSRKRKQPEAISMSQLIESTDRPEAAKLFYDVLVLQAKGIVNIQQQDSPYSDLQMILSSGQGYN